MRILMVAHNWRGEGTYVRALKLGQRLAARGHAVSLLATSPRPFGAERFEDGGVRVALAPHFRDTHRGGWGWLDLPWRAGWCLRHDFDLVHAFDHKPNVALPAWLYRVHKGTPLVSDWTDWWGKGGINQGAGTLKAAVEERAEERIRLLAGWVTAISPALVERAEGLGLPRERLLLLPGGGDPLAVAPLPRAAARKRLGLDPRAPLAVYMGLGSADLPMALRGFALLLKDKPKARLLLLGPMPGQKRALARAAGIEAACLIPGRVPDADMGAWLSAADCGLVPLQDSLLNRARWPNKTGEYWAAGLPVLANPVGLVADVIRKRKAGLCVPFTPEGFCVGLKRLCGTAEGRRMGRNGRTLVEGEFSWESLAGRLETFYRRRLESWRQGKG